MAKIYTSPYDMIEDHKEDLLIAANYDNFSDDEIEKIASWIEGNCKVSDGKYEDCLIKKTALVDATAALNEAKKLNEFTELPRRHSRINPTGKPTKYWVAVDEYSDSLNSYSKYVMPNMQLKDVDMNATPSLTVDKAQAVALAKRATQKWPTWHVFVGQDKYSHGMQTGKDHLRASTLYIWDPVVKMWNDNVDESKEKVFESMLKEAIDDYRTKLLNFIDVGVIDPIDVVTEILNNWMTRDDANEFAQDFIVDRDLDTDEEEEDDEELDESIANVSKHRNLIKHGDYSDELIKAYNDILKCRRWEDVYSIIKKDLAYGEDYVAIEGYENVFSVIDAISDIRYKFGGFANIDPKYPAVVDVIAELKSSMPALLMAIGDRFGSPFDAEELDEAKVDLSKKEGTFANIIAKNMSKFNSCKTKDDVIALCHTLLDEAGLDTEWTRKFFIRLGLTKSFVEALTYVVNAQQKGAGNGSVSKKRYYECDATDVDADIAKELDKADY